jgi:endonuclease/exonuclease/phosphatase family metal-dependent hydrolase
LVLATLALGSVAAACLLKAQPGAPQRSASLKIMTYNIQQGFDQEGNAALADQLRVIRSVDPDILGLQESDTARVANGNHDAVRYFADQLDMYSYYGPTTTTGTFGIALLSKYPIENPGTFFMYSPGEQTAALHARIRADGTAYNLLVTHLGNGGPMMQLEDILTRLEALDDVIIMGDFNFDPSTEQYALITQSLEDAWLLKWPDDHAIPGLPADDRIDHIFVSPGIHVTDASYGLSPASDHPFMVAVVEAPLVE